MIRSLGVDILVDLKGHTKGSRAGVLNHGAAPIQVAYLGFPGSGTGIDCDYILTDEIVTPETSRPFYHEKFCLLPDSYQANDNVTRPLPPAIPRSALGLPEDRIVFASFNAHRKITPVTAALWADILRRTDDSLLWVMCSNRFARDNLARWMENAGIASDRIIFADPVAYPDHIARLQAADIGLDTFPLQRSHDDVGQIMGGSAGGDLQGHTFCLACHREVCCARLGLANWLRIRRNFTSSFVSRWQKIQASYRR